MFLLHYGIFTDIAFKHLDGIMNLNNLDAPCCHGNVIVDALLMMGR